MAIIPGAKSKSFFALFIFGILVIFGTIGIQIAAERDFESVARPATQSESSHSSKVSQAYGQLPLQFEANQGQFDQKVRFVARSHRISVALSESAAIIQLQNKERVSSVSLKLLGARSAPIIKGEDELPGRSHYFIANNRQTNVISYAKVRQNLVYPGIDLVWHGNGQQIEHDFIIAPGAKPERIMFEISDAEKLQIDRQGDLLVGVNGSELRLQKPVAWQESNGQRQTIPCRFRLNEKRQISFELGDYDKRQELVIDPILIYSTHFGGQIFNGSSLYDIGMGIAVDQSGFAYIVGQTWSPQLPGPITLPYKNSPDAFITKLNRTGTAVVYTAYLGGSGVDLARSVGVDSAGNAYIAGNTDSSDFPKTAGAFSGTLEAFVTKLNPAGDAIVYSRLLGGNGTDEASGIAVGVDGSVYFTGKTNSGDLPATGFQSSPRRSLLFKSADGGNSWINSGRGLSGTKFNHLAIDPSNPNIFYAATNAGLFKSLDKGEHWQLKGVFPSFYSSTVFHLAIHPTTPAILFASTGNGLFISKDAGETWESKNSGIPRANPNSIPTTYATVFNPITPTTVYAAISSGVYRSVNGGDDWVSLGSLTFSGVAESPRRLVGAPTNPLSLYYGAELGLRKSVDEGFNWVAQFSEGVSDIAVDPQSPNTLYTGLASNAGGIVKTTNGGSNWVPINNGLLLPGGEYPARIIAVGIDPVSTSTLYISTTTEGLFKSQNGGGNWQRITNIPGNAQIQVLAVDSQAPANVYAGATGSEDAYVAKLDPTGTISYLTYLGGNENDAGYDVAVDAAGNAYVVGVTASANFPTRTPFQAALNGTNGTTDAFITKLNPTGSELIYSTYLGGDYDDSAYSLAVNAAGNAFVTGESNSFSWPTVTPLISFSGGQNGFVTKVSVNGQSLEYSSLLGGTLSDSASGIAIDKTGIAYVTGWTNSNNFPVKAAIQATRKGGADAFVTAINADGTGFIYSTYLGGLNGDFPSAITVDGVGNAYITGNTSSADFPITNMPLPGGGDIFIAKIGEELDLALTQSASRNPVMIGNNLTYTLSLTNRGPSAATNTFITDQLPPNVTVVSATPSQGNCSQSAGAITCQLGTLSARTSAIVTLVINPNTAGNITNTAHVTSNEPEFDSSNNQTSLTIRVSNLPSIAGRIADASGKAIGGIALNLTGSQTASQVTDANGFYQFADVPLGGSFVVRPASNVFSVEPESRSFNNVTGDQSGNFVATTCTYTLSANNQSFSANGGNGSFTVTAPPRCPWTATATASWVSISSGANGAGNGQVNFAVAPTTTSARNARIRLADQNFAIYQELNSCPEPRFGTRTYSLAGQTFSMLAADLTGDGRADLVASGQLFKGNGDGSFAKPVVVPSLLSNPIADDLNADGSLDLAFINNSGRLSVLTNNGSGMFSAPKDFDLRTGLPPEAEFRGQLFTGQFNPDNAPDIIIGYSISTSSGIPTTGVIILLNDGTGRFGSPNRTLLNSYHLSGVDDLTGDGLSDLLATSNFSVGRSFLVFPANGNASFGAPLSISADGEIRQAEFNDFNGDGKTDAALYLNYESSMFPHRNYVAILLGDGTGRLSVSATADINLNVARIFVSDFNNDAKPDVLALSRGAVTYFRGDGTGKLGAGFDTLVFPAFDSISASAMADFNLDGRPDFVRDNSDKMNYSVHLNRCAGGNFIAGRITDRIFTTTGLTGVTVKLGGTNTATTQTDEGGNYEFGGLAAGGNFTVTPERGGFEFVPNKQSISNLTADQIADFNGARLAVAVSAASFKLGAIAPDSIASIFGIELAAFTSSANGLPLPLTLGNTLAVFRAASGFQRTAPLFFVSPGQINLLVPSDLPIGKTSISVGGFAGTPFSLGSIELESVVPGLFSADATGQGLAAAVALRIHRDGSQVYEAVARFDPTQNRIVAVPIDLSNTDDQMILLLFGTGFRRRSQSSTPEIKFGGVDGETLYAGAQGDFVGLDQINVKLPRNLSGRGEVEVSLIVEGKPANMVKVAFK